MITGRVTSEREAVVPLQLQAPEGQPETVEAVIDTGFTEFVALPPDRVAGLGLPLVGLQQMILADGSITTVSVHEAVVHWHGARLPVQALEVQGGVLLGMALLRASRVTMDIVEDGPVRIEPMGEAG